MNGAARHYVPLTKRHLQKLETKKIDCYAHDKFGNGHCQYDSNGAVSYKKDAKDR